MAGRSGRLLIVPGIRASTVRAPAVSAVRGEIADEAPLGLYLHVPFCASICNYCNFTRGLYDETLKTQYVDALLEEIQRSDRRRGADTVYFGGGTPSLLDPTEIARLVEACDRTFGLDADAEITLEANPETLSPARLEAFRRGGVNRLSVGVQSMREGELQLLGRQHGTSRVLEVCRWAREAGLENVSVDLMLWLPGQTVDEWLESVAIVLTLAVDHVSLYMLEVYPQAPLRQAMARAGVTQPGDEVAAEMYERGLARLEAAGFAQYEISNAARPGREARHNLKYWSDGAWLGFGCGAHSTVGAERWRNVTATAEYVQRIGAGAEPVSERSVRPTEERLQDALFMGLRRSAGIDLESIGRRYGVDVWERYGEALAPYLQADLLRKAGARLQLSRRGMLLAHEVMSVFV